MSGPYQQRYILCECLRYDQYYFCFVFKLLQSVVYLFRHGGVLTLYEPRRANSLGEYSDKGENVLKNVLQQNIDHIEDDDCRIILMELNRDKC